MKRKLLNAISKVLKALGNNQVWSREASSKPQGKPNVLLKLGAWQGLVWKQSLDRREASGAPLGPCILKTSYREFTASAIVIYTVS